MAKNIVVEGLNWDITLRELITTFQYSAAIQLEITRPLDPANLRATLRFSEERRFHDVKRALDLGNLAVAQENGVTCPLREIKGEVEQKTNTVVTNDTSSLNDLIGRARRDTDMQGQNEGELPVLQNGNFEQMDVRRFCRVCNVELPSITNYTMHRKGKKHLKRQDAFDRSGKYADDIQVALARGETLWQKAGQKTGTASVIQQTPMQREMKKLIENQPLDKFCPICGITLTSPVVCLSHYIGKNHIKKAALNSQFDNHGDIVKRIESLVQQLQSAKSKTKSVGGFNETFKRARHAEFQSEHRRNYMEEYNRRTEELGQRRKLPPRQSSIVTETGLRHQRKNYTRIFNEPNPIGDVLDGGDTIMLKHEFKQEFEEGEVDDGDEIIDQGALEEVVL